MNVRRTLAKRDRNWRWLFGGGVLFLLGCHAEHNQSMLHPASRASAEIAWLWWFLFGICTFVLVVVTALVLAAVLPRRRAAGNASPLGDRFILTSGAILPGVVLSVVLVVSVRSQVSLQVPDADLVVEVIGHQFWWEVRYPGHNIVTANEIYVPVGEPVRLALSSADVIHSLWVPNLNGKTDLLPDKVNWSWFTAERPGIYRGQCAEYCGVQHALMGLVVVALPAEEFESWLEAQSPPPEEPATEQERRGKEVFFEAACNNCHAIANTAAVGLRGPDLTHIGSRRTLAAGLLANNRANLAGWITDPQALKPHNLMPRTYLSAEDLHALVEYLEGLK